MYLHSLNYNTFSQQNVLSFGNFITKCFRVWQLDTPLLVGRPLPKFNLQIISFQHSIRLSMRWPSLGTVVTYHAFLQSITVCSTVSLPNILTFTSTLLCITTWCETTRYRSGNQWNCGGVTLRAPCGAVSVHYSATYHLLISHHVRIELTICNIMAIGSSSEGRPWCALPQPKSRGISSSYTGYCRGDASWTSVCQGIAVELDP